MHVKGRLLKELESVMLTALLGNDTITKQPFGELWHLYN